MAKFHTGKNANKTMKCIYRLSSLAATPLCVGTMGYGLYSTFVQAAPAPLLTQAVAMMPYILGAAVLGEIGDHHEKKYLILDSGIKGEERANSILTRLSNGYEVFSNVHVANTELDAVVVGDNGVFVVETKNNKGTIFADTGRAKWDVKKAGYHGGKSPEPMNNPLVQLKWHVHVLAEHFKRQGVPVWIDSVVFFSNPMTRLVNAPAQVLSSDTSLLQHISRYQPHKFLSRREKEGICRVLSECIK